MIITKYNNYLVSEKVFDSNINRIINQCYKILCYREENKEWWKPLQTIILDLIGLQRLIEDESLLILISKLESLFFLTKENDFFNFRRMIFECLGLLDGVKKCKD